ncbi:MAG: hypothetical protein F6K35_13720 [Okeania sp. SIO2H7]|nr:hypothetical protein [Okeania sp. SIO2H7]
MGNGELGMAKGFMFLPFLYFYKDEMLPNLLRRVNLLVMFFGGSDRAISRTLDLTPIALLTLLLPIITETALTTNLPLVLGLPFYFVLWRNSSQVARTHVSVGSLLSILLINNLLNLGQFLL